MRKQVSFYIIFAFLVFCLFALESAHAYEFYIDNFTVTRNDAVIFNDTFNDGNPPPIAPNFANGSPASYFLHGTMGPESSGKLTLDSSGALPMASPTGDPFIQQRALLLTNIEPENTTAGLKQNFTFSATGVFDLIIPTELREAYDIMFTDQTPTNTPNDIAMMRVIRTQNDDLMIQFAHLDYVLNTVTFIEQTPLDTGHDQIALTLTRASTSTDAITGSFYYIDGGIAGSTTTFVNTMNIFNGENFTRAAFEAFTPAVPEPATMLLLVLGLIGLAGIRRKMQK